MSERTIFHVALLGVAAYMTHRSSTAPTPPPKDHEVKHDATPMERFFGQFARRIGDTIKVSALWQRKTLSLMCSRHGQVWGAPLPCWSQGNTQANGTVLRELVHVSIGAATRIQLTPSILMGAVLTIMGAGIRMACFRALGRFFTFEVTVKEGHQLCTRGPYSIVRHPSYTGWILQTIGIALCTCSAGSWAREAGWLDTSAGMTVAGAYLGIQVYTALGMLLRCSKEDALMRKQFEKQWDEWAGRVRYRLIPFVY